VLIFMLSIVHSTLRKQEQRLPFAERITAAELLEALEVQRAIQRSGVDLETAVAEAEQRDQSNVASFDLSGKGPRKGPPA
jgi:hypothetical protein